MSTSVLPLEAQVPWAPQVVPLDEAVWGAWVAKCRAQDRRRGAARIRAVKWFTIATLLVAVGFGSSLASYELPVRFIVGMGAIAVMMQAFHARNFVFAGMFGAIALLYNPVAPVLGYSGGWQRTAAFATAVLFVASLAWRNVGSRNE